VSTAWRYTAMILAGSALLLAAGLYTACSGLAMSRGPRGLRETRTILRELGGEPGLAARKAALAGMAARLRQERTARAADGGAFSRRVEEAFAELGLVLASSSDWAPVPKLKIAGAAAFQRTFAGTGPFDRLLDAVATLESWPDEVRVRSLSVVRQGPGRVAFTLEVTAVRTVVKKEEG
jgi:hypothetical protein